jgi:hypothetical protein
MTLNHLETIIEMVNTKELTDLIKDVIDRLLKLYTTFNNGQWLRLKQSLFRFVQGKRVKVSLFLQHQMQASDGAIITDLKGKLQHGTEIPGNIRFFEGDNVVSSRNFDIDSKATFSETANVIEADSSIGSNMYAKDFKPDAKIGPVIASSVTAMRMIASYASSLHEMKSQPKTFSNPSFSAITATSAKAELNMLADLLGLGIVQDTKSDNSEGKHFKINLFPDSGFDSKNDNFEGEAKHSDHTGMIVLDIDATADAKSLQSYLEQLDFNDSKPEKQSDSKYDDDDDLLALMDSAK